MHAAASTTDERIDLGTDEHRQPFSLHPEAKVATDVELDSRSESEGKTSEAAAVSYANVRCADAAYYIGSRPNRPIIEKVFVREITVKLVQNGPLFGRSLAAFQMDTGVLPRPTELDHVLFVATHAGSDAIARRRINSNIRRGLLGGPRGKAHAGSKSDERSDIETEGLGRRLLTFGCLRNTVAGEQ